MTNSLVKGLSKCGTEMPWRPIVQQEKKIEIALFRLGTIAPIVYGECLRQGDKEALIRSLTGQKVRIPYSPRSRLARSTIMEWVSMYEQSGRRLQSLFPKDRSGRGVPRSIRAEEKNALLEYLERNPTTFACRAYRNLFEQGIVSSRLSVSSLSRILKAEKMTRRDRLERLKAKQLTEAVQLPRNEYEWGMCGCSGCYRAKWIERTSRAGSRGSWERRRSTCYSAASKMKHPEPL